MIAQHSHNRIDSYAYWKQVYPHLRPWVWWVHHN
jgi:hypothetical protein